MQYFIIVILKHPSFPDTIIKTYRSIMDHAFLNFDDIRAIFQVLCQLNKVRKLLTISQY